MPSLPSKYRNYSADGTYWTVRKVGATFWVARIDNKDGFYRWVETWGGYQFAGAAGGAAAQLAYRQAVLDTTNRLRDVLHGVLDEAGLGAPTPPAPQVPAKSAPIAQGEADSGGDEI